MFSDIRWWLDIGHGGRIHTMTIGKHYKSGFSPLLDSWLYTFTSTQCLFYLKIPVFMSPVVAKHKICISIAFGELVLESMGH